MFYVSVGHFKKSRSNPFSNFVLHCREGKHQMGSITIGGKELVTLPEIKLGEGGVVWVENWESNLRVVLRSPTQVCIGRRDWYFALLSEVRDKFSHLSP